MKRDVDEFCNLIGLLQEWYKQTLALLALVGVAPPDYDSAR